MRRDRVILKGFGLYFEGEGRPALTLTYCGTGLLMVIIMAGIFLAQPAVRFAQLESLLWRTAVSLDLVQGT